MYDWILICQEIRLQTYTSTVFVEALVATLKSSGPMLNIKAFIKKLKNKKHHGTFFTFLFTLNFHNLSQGDK